MKSSPELMTAALNLHNGVMRKVRWENCGFTVEQEGDSFTFVFYTAVDAAAFCLQVGRGGLLGRRSKGPLHAVPAVAHRHSLLCSKA